MCNNQNVGGLLASQSEYVLGIDLGTSNSCVSVYGMNGMDVIEIPEEGFSVPSVVRFPDRQKNNLQVGRLAKKYIVSKPDEVFSSFKTQMASSEWSLDPKLQEKFTIDKELLTPTFMAHLVLSKIREAVQRHPVYGAAGTICKAVICVPALSQSTYVENVYKAAEAAGFGLSDMNTGEPLYDDKTNKRLGIKILEEPTAAAIAYGLVDNFFVEGRNRKQKLLIYDFGGGTFDVTILEVESHANCAEPTFTFINKGGDSHLGGDDLDWALVDLLARKISQSTGYDILAGEDSLMIKSILKLRAEEAKIDFSNGLTDFQLIDTIRINGQIVNINEHILKDEFIEAINPLINKTVDIMLSVLKSSNIDLDNINRIVLVGGSSKGPWIVDTLKEKLGKDPFFAPNVDTFVSAGASYFGVNPISVERGVKDILSMNYGIEINGSIFSPILVKSQKFESDTISRTIHYTNTNDTGQLSLTGWTYPAELEITEENGVLTCPYSVHQTNQNGDKLFNYIGEFNIEIPRQPAGTLDIEITMTIHRDKTLILTGKVDNVPINPENIKWNF